jgi:hypothetical protein
MNITVDPYRRTSSNARSHGPLPAATLLMPSHIGKTASRRFLTLFPHPVSRDALINGRAAAIARTRGT